MPTLILNNNSGTNPQSINLTNYLQLALEAKADPASPQFSTRQFTTSLLKEGATFTLENAKLKEQVFPLLIGPNTNSSLAVATIIAINQILETPGAVAEWQDDGGIVSPTYFTLASGQLDVNYNYRESAQHWISCTLRLFSQPYGTTAAPRFYCAASAVGPLLMISPYASGGVQAIAASTQAGVAGFGGRQQGASSGIFYGGNPSLAGDAPVVLQMSYAGPLAPGASTWYAVPTVVVSWLPDQFYQPLFTTAKITNVLGAGASAGLGTQAGAVNGNYWHTTTVLTANFNPLAQASSGVAPTAQWVGNHRIFAIARASGAPASLQVFQSTLIPFTTTATVYPGDWQLIDIGIVPIRASEPSQQIVQMQALPGSFNSSAFDLTAIVMLPDNASWFMNGGQFSTSAIYESYGAPPGYSTGAASAPFTNTFLIDDTLPDQFLYQTSNTAYAPSPAGMAASSARITQYTRGIVPRPDPSRGIPILAVLSVAQLGSLSNPQNLQTMAQVNVLERARYTLP